MAAADADHFAQAAIAVLVKDGPAPRYPDIIGSTFWKSFWPEIVKLLPENSPNSAAVKCLSPVEAVSASTATVFASGGAGSGGAVEAKSADLMASSSLVEAVAFAEKIKKEFGLTHDLKGKTEEIYQAISLVGELYKHPQG